MKMDVKSAPHGSAKGATTKVPSPRPSSRGGETAGLSQESIFAAKVTSSPREQAIVAQNLAAFPPEVLVRGVLFAGLAEVIAKSKGSAVLAELQRTAGTPPHVVPFRQYPHRDFHKFYYVAARALHPSVPLPTALRLVARLFFPIFRASPLGKTIGALMGSELGTRLPLLAKAYGLWVSGNHHTVEAVGERALVWRARAEAVAWYEETFQGIIEGTAPASPSPDAAADASKPSAWLRPAQPEAAPRAGPANLCVKPVSRTVDGKLADYVFQITW
jgi:uncharacterized protein (TIGR02265 family)